MLLLAINVRAIVHHFAIYLLPFLTVHQFMANSMPIVDATENNNDVSSDSDDSTSLTTFKLDMGDQQVFVRRVEVSQIEMRDLDHITHSCPVDGTFVSVGINEFQLDWTKCRIRSGVDTIQLVIHFATSADASFAEEAAYKVEFHSEQIGFFNSEYHIDMGWLPTQQQQDNTMERSNNNEMMITADDDDDDGPNQMDN